MEFPKLELHYNLVGSDGRTSYKPNNVAIQMLRAISYKKNVKKIPAKFGR